jgi:hypothetical protein
VHTQRGREKKKHNRKEWRGKGEEKKEKKEKRDDP